MATEPHIEQVATATAKATVREMLMTLGIDVSTPDGILRAQRDFAFLRDLRKGSEAVKRKALLATVSAIALFLLACIWLGLRIKINS